MDKRFAALAFVLVFAFAAQTVAALAVTFPNGGELLINGSQQSITWTDLGSVTNVTIEYSNDDFMTSTVIVSSAPNTGSYAWSVPAATSTTARVRISDSSNPTVSSTSDWMSR